MLRRSLLPGLLRSVALQPEPRRAQRASLRGRHRYSAPPRAASSPRSARWSRGVLPALGTTRPGTSRPFRSTSSTARASSSRSPRPRRRAASRCARRSCRHLQPGRSAEVAGRRQVVGWIGEVHPAVLEAFEASAPVTAFELDLAALVREAADRQALLRRAALPGRRARRRTRGSRGRHRRAREPGDELGGQASCSNRCGSSTCTAERVCPPGRNRSPSRSSIVHPTGR